jgi:hypothetical protein
MDPYLEQPMFWSSFHSRLIVAIADAIEPQLSPQYYVEVETRTYQSDEEDGEVLVGIPDAVVFSDAQATGPEPPHERSAELSVATEVWPQPVTCYAVANPCRYWGCRNQPLIEF